MTRQPRPGYRLVDHGWFDYAEECPDMREEPITEDESPDREAKPPEDKPRDRMWEAVRDMS